MKTKNIIYFILLIGVLINFTHCGYFKGAHQNVIEDDYLYIRTNATYQEVLDSLKLKLKDLESFVSYAETKDFSEKIKAGKYKLNKEDTNEKLLNRLLTGTQEEVRLMIKNEPTIFHLAGSVSKMIEADSAQIVEAIIEFAQKKDGNFNEETVKYFFLPNTYHFFWNTSAEQFVNRMEKEFNKVWNEERQAKSEEMNFSPLEVFTLASIVQMEASKVDEQPKVAQAYLNRLKKGMKLEADPTSIYAYKLENGFDPIIQRVRSGHLATPSEYNTYRVLGLPPAPICLPNLSAVDAVLNPEEHNYVFFCADPDRPGYHSFTNSYEQHLRNAAKYRRWLEEMGIQ